jgi:hypothetical protein
VTEAAETAAGRTASVVAAAPVGITTYDADGDRRRRHCPRGAATADVMMTMAGERGGEATARRRRGDGEATTRQRRGNKDAKAIGYGAAGGRGNKAIDKRITNNRT